MSVKISLPGITFNKAVIGKLLSLDLEKKTVVVEFPDTTATFNVAESDETLATLVGANVSITPDGTVTLSGLKKAQKIGVKNTHGCDDQAKRMFMQGH
jgi:hypothetical protein